jgi:hypothetical protein
MIMEKTELTAVRAKHSDDNAWMMSDSQRKKPDKTRDGSKDLRAGYLLILHLAISAPLHSARILTLQGHHP